MSARSTSTRRRPSFFRYANDDTFRTLLRTAGFVPGVGRHDHGRVSARFRRRSDHCFGGRDGPHWRAPAGGRRDEASRDTGVARGAARQVASRRRLCRSCSCQARKREEARLKAMGDRVELDSVRVDPLEEVGPGWTVSSRSTASSRSASGWYRPESRSSRTQPVGASTTGRRGPTARAAADTRTSSRCTSR
jgi:hypothetical protein